MSKEWRLDELNINLDKWGKYKGQHIGTIKFGSDENEYFMLNLTPEKTREFIDLISGLLCSTTNELGKKLKESLNIEENESEKKIA